MASSDIANELDPESVGRWITGNWELVVGMVLGTILIVILLKYTYTKKKPALKAAATNFKNRTMRNRKQPTASFIVSLFIYFRVVLQPRECTRDVYPLLYPA